MSKQLTALSTDSIVFPDPNTALDEPDGLLAIGGDLSPERLYNAYQQAIFPWFSEPEPILWWSPSERAVVQPQQVHISKSMAKFIRQTRFTVTINHAFQAVVKGCAQPRQKQPETWISSAIQSAYYQLYQVGMAHSVEVWDQDHLVGGLYGVNVGRIFCGESMFHQQTNASKLAFIAFSQHFSRYHGQLIDCQMMTEHLKSLGVVANSRQAFLKQLSQHKDKAINRDCWQPQKIRLNEGN